MSPEKLVAEAHGLRDEVHLLRRDNRRWLVSLTVGVVALLLVALVGYGQQRQDERRREQSRALIQETKATSDRIKSCTDPSGACYRDGQARTASAIASLVLSDVRVSECVVASGGQVPMFRACVKAKGLPLE